MNKISLIIVHWNTPVFLKKQLKHLPSGSDIIVVDNNSKESLSWLKKEFPRVKLIENNKNLGYAAACNQGAKLAKGPAPRSSKSEVGEWLLFLNPDVEISGAEIQKMIKQAEEKKYDACSPMSSAAGYHKPLPTTNSLLIEFSPLNIFISLDAMNPKTLFGGCLLIKKSVLDKLGGWDEDFFLWFEDSDLTRRLLNNNCKIGWIPLKVNHSGGASFKKLDDSTKRKMFFNSMKIYADKHFSVFGKFVVSIIRKKYL